MTDVSPAAAQSQRIDFSVDPAIIRSLIREQASSLAKAIAELVMNAVDAKATLIEISLNKSGFSVRDNGEGFASREDILRNFGRFGAPHEAGDATFGRFRVGRGQIMHWARSTWISNGFEMAVDINDPVRGISFDLTTTATPTPGCVVQGSFYDPEASIQLRVDPVAGLTQLIKFVDADVVLNGKAITTRPSAMKDGYWSKIDRLAYWKLDRNDETLRIYNLGVLAQTYACWQYGVGGVIVTREPLSLNMARNEIIYDPVKAAINSGLHLAFEQSLKDHDDLTNAERQRFIANCMETGDQMRVPLKRLRALKVFKGPADDFFSYSQIVRFPAITLYPDGRRAQAERLLTKRLAFPFSMDNFAPLFDEDDPYAPDEESIQEIMHQIWQTLDPNEALPYPGLRSFTEIAASADGKSKIIDEDDLSDQEELGLAAARTINESCFGGARRIIPGESDAAHAWTDGALYVAINRELLDRVGDPENNGAFHELYLTIAHEYAHDNSSAGSHLHGLEFYRQYHDLTIDSDRLTAFSEIQAMHEAVVSGNLLDDLQHGQLSPPDAPWRSQPNVIAALQKLKTAASMNAKSSATAIVACASELVAVLQSTGARPADFQMYLSNTLETLEPATQNEVYRMFAAQIAAGAGPDIPSIP